MLKLALALAVVSVVFGLVEKLFHALPQRRPRPGLGTDVAYWFFTPLVSKGLTKAALVVALAPVLIYRARHPEPWGMGRQPVGLQAIEILVLGDFLGYWSHRWFHRARGWPFHAIHHMSVELDWLASVRLHPLNEVAAKLWQVIPLALLGYSAKPLAAYVPFLTFYAILLHANVPWSLGPLGKVFASPAFHRWHHTSAEEGRDRNFGGLLVVWDRLFGTYHLPPHQPTRFGVAEAIPETIWGQLVYPYRSSRNAS